MTTQSPMILIIDDAPNNLQLLSRLLVSQGYQIKLTVSGKFALEFVRKIQPDLILLDINMPDMDGFEVCKKLKSLPETQYIPVIFISAFNNLNDKIKALQVGGIDYITKPFEAEEIVLRIKNQLNLYTLYKQTLEKYTQLEQELQEYKKLHLR